jgi:hypothetical protein
MHTWVMPEFISWKITRGRKTMCKGSCYNQWYAMVSTNCRLPKGNYKLICYDKKRQGFKGGYIKIAGKKTVQHKKIWLESRLFANSTIPSLTMSKSRKM